MINFNNASVGYGKKVVLNNVNLDIKKGEITTFLGPNGSGKTTLMSTINGLNDLLSGDLFINDTNIKHINKKRLATLVATVPQIHNTSFNYKVFDIVLSGRSPYISYLPKKNDIEKTKEAISKIGIEYLQDKEFTKLSGGEKQLVMIARAITQETEIILLDEPTSYLDLKNQIKVLNLVKSINQENKVTCIMTLHEPNYALAYSNNVVLVNKGSVNSGLPDEIIQKDNIKDIYDVNIDMITKNGYKYVLPNYAYN